MKVVDDVLSIILYYLEIEDIKSYCISHKNNIGDSRNFWINIFNRDGLDIITPQHTFSQWIAEYRKTLHANYMAEKLVRLFLQEYQTHDVYIIIKCSNDKVNILSLLPQLNEEMTNKILSDPVITIELTKEANIIRYTDSSITAVYPCTIYEIVEFLFQLLYYYPSTILTDQFDIPYIMDKNYRPIKMSERLRSIVAYRRSYWQ